MVQWLGIRFAGSSFTRTTQLKKSMAKNVYKDCVDFEVRGIHFPWFAYWRFLYPLIPHDPRFPHSPIRYSRISLLQLPHVPRYNTYSRSHLYFLMVLPHRLLLLPSRTKTSLSPMDVSVRRFKLNR
ncbi:hypothetical protein EYC84_006815 [Monilinia fructicola]|uniref:Uncharacterized protein n=1 Tax=Monilinia fructicola TaxID=38448 RepID=A0A5M9K558_MONFR|nr:hypothetical protein EYC84_006815 [Monilinia fructicola]